jgi:coatomer subunit beta
LRKEKKLKLNFLELNFPGDTLQNCTLELATVGDLKLVERPQPVVLAPHDFCNIKANVKVSSTENGIIFGNIGKFRTFSFF